MITRGGICRPAFAVSLRKKREISMMELEQDKEETSMKTLLKIPVTLFSLVVSLFIWLCAGLISCSAFVFKIASSLLSVIAAGVMLTGDVTNAALLFLLAFLVSPMGVPMLVVKLLGRLGA